MYIYIMRHGETYWNKEGRIQGSSDIGLTDYGVELAELSAEGFLRDGIRFDRIYTSPLIRALKTAEVIAEKDLASADRQGFSAMEGRGDDAAEAVSDPEYGDDLLRKSGSGLYIDSRLREMSFGKYEGILLRERRQHDENIVLCFSEPSKYVPDPTGETYEDVFARIDDFMDRELLPLESEPGIENVLVICHGTVIRAFLRRIHGTALDDFWKMKQPNCCINKIELKDGVFTSVQENILYYESEELMNRGIL